MSRIGILAAAAGLATAFSTMAFAADNLFNDLGGADGIKAIANQTADNFLADPRVGPTFDNTNMDRFRKLLAEQFCQVAGGPCTYTGRDMHSAHKGLHLTNVHFNAVVEDLQNAMDKQHVPFATQNRFLARLAPMQHDIVTK